MQVPLLDLKAQYATIRDEVLGAVEAVLASQLVCNGPAVREFEKQVSAYCGTASALGVSSGTDALLMSLMALGIGAGDEVITSPFTFFATAGCIWRTGARPAFVDIDPVTFNIDPAAIEAAITPRTKAIMPVHLYGQVAAMDLILAIAKKYGLFVIEDAAQAIGATFNGLSAGSLGTTGCFSFYPTKNLGAMGDAGAVTTQDAALADKLAKFLNHGQTEQYFHRFVGGNFRMDSVQGAVLSVKLRYLEQWTEKRRANAARYNELLAGCEEVSTPVELPDRRHIYHQYVIRAKRRDELQAFLKQQGVASGIYYPLGLHLQQCFAELGHKKGDLPQTEKACEEVLALPVYPELSEEQLQYVSAQLKGFYAKKN